MKYRLIENSSHTTIIFYHGWGGNIDNNERLINQLFDLGYSIVIPELINHDSRNPIDNYFSQENAIKYFWETIYTSIDEFVDLMDGLNIKTENAVVLGISMGGFIASGILKKYPKIKGLVCINGSASFSTSEKIFRITTYRDTIDKDEELKMKLYDPINIGLINSYVLFLHGEKDSVVSIEGVRDFIHKNPSNKIKLSTYREVNHTVENYMIEDLKKWLLKLDI